jgi:hypothetical protein
MAVIVGRYKKSPHDAKETVKYIEHRPRHDRSRSARRLFGLEGTMSRQDAYTLIDLMSQQGTYLYYHWKLSPDPKRESTDRRDLDLEAVTRVMMNAIADSVGPVVWIAAIHPADHTAIPHVHAVAMLPRTLSRDELRAAREATTQACLAQRCELDRAREQQRVQTEQREEGLELCLARSVS